MQISAINIGQARTQQRKDYIETTGIYKLPVAGPIYIGHVGIEGDAICDTRHHGGPDQAIYVYGSVEYDWWATELGSPLEPGTFGENLTISGFSDAQINIGDCLQMQEVTLQVTAPRIPCGTFATRMGDPQWVKKFRQAERPGIYCRVLRQGWLNTGEAVTIERYSGTTLSLQQMYRAYYEKNRTEALLQQQLDAPISMRMRLELERELGDLRAKI